MNIEQLAGRCLRLRQELAVAYSSVPWNTGLIDRLTDELAATERGMAAASLGYVRVVKTPSAATDSPRISGIADCDQEDAMNGPKVRG